jgi:anaerobic ribonucleoside-triphosphate reductase activating protein
MDKSKLNLAAVCCKTRVLGPGERAAIWIQGCPFRCPECISPTWLPFIQAELHDPQILAQGLLSDPEIEGITISGGEPITQSTALVDFLEHCRKIRDIDVIMFTGYYYENLLAFPFISPAQQLLKLIDVLIDGPYVAAKNDNRGLRGSSNQRVIHLSQKLIDYDFINIQRQTEIQISNGVVFMKGVPPKGVLPGVMASLEKSLDATSPGGTYERA